MKKNIIVLTKSRKHSGYCVAGLDCDTGEWIRLISSDDETEGAVPEHQITYIDGSTLQIYDVIKCEILYPCPTSIQPENWFYDETEDWEKVGESCLAEVIDIHGYDQPNFIFYDEQVSLPSNWKFKGEPSLYLLSVEDACVWVKTFEQGKQTVSLTFTYNGVDYKYMRISQTEIKEYFINKCDGSYPEGDQTIICSLTDRYFYNGKYYKVVAQILK